MFLNLFKVVGPLKSKRFFNAHLYENPVSDFMGKREDGLWILKLKTHWDGQKIKMINFRSVLLFLIEKIKIERIKKIELNLFFEWIPLSVGWLYLVIPSKFLDVKFNL